jgi:hypothetical protein
MSASLDEQVTKIMERILTALDIKDPTRGDVLKEIVNYTADKKIKLLNYTQFEEHLDKMIKADSDLHDLLKNNEELSDYYNRDLIKVEWDKSMEELAKLQGLIILRKVVQKDCDSLIKSILNAFNLKITAVNNILSSDLSANKSSEPSETKLASPAVIPSVPLVGGNVDEALYKAKYLKYKAKYLNLIKNNF